MSTILKSLAPVGAIALLALAPHSARALGYMPPPPNLTVINGSAFDNGSMTTTSGSFTFAPGFDNTSTQFSTVGQGGVETDNASTILFTGGYVGNLTTKDNSLATFAGGQDFRIGSEGNSTVNITGGKFQNLYTFDNSVIDLFGTNLMAVNDPGFISGIVDLSGTLSDGTPVKGFYEANQSMGGTLEFNGVPVQPVPEASTTVSLGLLLMLGMGGLAVAKRKKTA